MNCLLLFGLCLSTLVAIFGVLVEVFDGGLGSIISNKGTSYVAQKKENNPPYPSDTPDNIFWIVQLTDLHISRYTGLSRAPDLTTFLQDHIPIIKPDIVLVTGDITDAKTSDQQGSMQYVDEWQAYWNAVQKSGITKQVKYLDIRGNHDAFDLADLESSNNYYREYSEQGRLHKSSYTYEHKTSYGKYSFIGVDACPDPGPRRPFNFFGVLKQNQMSELSAWSKQAHNSNMTIWFGHYPTNTIVDNASAFRQLLGGDIVYLCGHLHTLAGLVPNLYTYQDAGYLELELGDWKDNRLYRVLAVDHDLLSFTDAHFEDWPIVLITNPKQALYQVPHHEPLERIAKSTHIRMLLFSTSTITQADVSIDGEKIGAAHLIKGPLYALSWDPSRYATGLHSIQVHVQDASGRKKLATQTFSIRSQDKPHFSVAPSLILMMHADAISKLTFFVGVLYHLLPLVLLRFYKRPQHALLADYRLFPFSSLSRFLNKWIRNLWLLAQSDFHYYGLLAYALYIVIGPWFIGDVIHGYTGMAFTWGVYVNEKFFLTGLTFLYGFFQILTFNIPLTLYLASIMDTGLKDAQLPHRSWSFNNLRLKRDWAFIFLVIWQSYLAVSGIYQAYGGLALVLGPIRTWGVIYAFILRENALRRHSHVKLNKEMCSKVNGYS